MSEPAEQPRGDRGVVLGYLLSITTWERAFIAIFLGTATLFLWLVYQNPQRVFELMQHAIFRRPAATQPYLTPLGSDIERVLTLGFPTLGPHAIGIVALRVEMQANLAQVVAWKCQPGYTATFNTVYEERWRYPQALFGSDRDLNHAIAQAFIGRFYCTKDVTGLEGLRRFPVKELCAVGIPPDGYGLGGLVLAAWDEEVPWNELATIERNMRGIAGDLTWHPRKQAP